MPIVVGGAHPTTASERVLEDENIDLVVMGEGEQTLLEVVEMMLKRGGAFPTEDQLGDVQGVAFRQTRPTTATSGPAIPKIIETEGALK